MIELLYRESFDEAGPGASLPPAWWVEGGEDVWLQEGRLWVRADAASRTAPGNVCTVWCDRTFGGDIQVDVDAHVVRSRVQANNINLFLHYSDPAGQPLTGTRAARAGGQYALYHALNGYIVTFLNDWRREGPPASDGGAQARVRMRRCPGFELIAEAYGYHCRAGTTYHLSVQVDAEYLRFAVDGRPLLRGAVSQPWCCGLLGLRTFQTELWWDDLRVWRI